VNPPGLAMRFSVKLLMKGGRKMVAENGKIVRDMHKRRKLKLIKKIGKETQEKGEMFFPIEKLMEADLALLKEEIEQKNRKKS
jgi:hypothetical protein